MKSLINWLLFIPLWIMSYLFRIVWYDIIISIIIEPLMDIITLHILNAIFDFIISIICLPLDIIIGLFVTCVCSIGMIIDLNSEEVTIFDIFKEIYKKSKRTKYHLD